MLKKFVAMIMVLCMIVGLSACSQSYEKALEGSWYREGRDEPAFTFYSDGTCTSGSGSGTGTWAIVNDNQLKITAPVLQGGDTAVLTIESLEDGTLTLSMEGNEMVLYDKPH